LVSAEWKLSMFDASTFPDFTRFQAAIFDLDGTLVHSEHVWDAAKLEVLAQYGHQPSRSLLDAHLGRGLSGFLDDVFGRPLAAKERLEIGNQIGARADVLLPEMRRPVKGAAAVLCRLHDSNRRIAICSSSPRRHILGALTMLGIADRVETIVSGAEMPRGKPDPLPYVTTLEVLALDPGVVCAFEDSVAGVASASSADLAVFAIGAGCSGPEFSHCAYAAESFDHLLTTDFDQAFGR
jgi:sugar-phosphatase